MAKRFCGDVRISISYRWSMNQYKATVTCTRGSRTVRITLADIQKRLEPTQDFTERDTPAAYDFAAKLALDSAMDSTSAEGDIQAYIAKEIADAAACGLEVGGYKILREKDYTAWVARQVAESAAPMFASNA